MQAAGWEAASSWARSGVMALCGNPGGPPLLPPLGAPARLAEVVDEIGRRTEARGRRITVSWEAALAGRAEILGLVRAGRASANGSCGLISAADGDVALNLPRPDDLSLIPALVSEPSAASGPWEASARFAGSVPAVEFVERARLLGLAASSIGERVPGDAYLASRRGPQLDASFDVGGWTVVDLSSLWAGPLAARILAEAGADLIKVEDPSRPDGARRRPDFYSWIHSPTETTEHIEFTSAPGRRRLRELLETADVVIESSRPRALEQIGLAPEQLRVPAGQVWLSITGHGRAEPSRGWIGFGDDAAIAGGLVCRDEHGHAAFCGDAIADPVTGLVAALAVLRCVDAGGGFLVDASLSGVAAWAAGGLQPEPLQHGIRIERAGESWVVRRGNRAEPVATVPPTLDWI